MKPVCERWLARCCLITMLGLVLVAPRLWADEIKSGVQFFDPPAKHKPEITTAHRARYVCGSVNSRGQLGSYRLYRGQMQAADNIRLTWERRGRLVVASTSTRMGDLSDPGLRIYNGITNEVIDVGTDTPDRLHQVVVKVYARSDVADGIGRETFTLAIDRELTLVSGPAFSVTLVAPHGVEPAAVFALEAKVRNSGDLVAHNTQATLKLPVGFSLESGAAIQPLDSIGDGVTKTLRWTVRAPAAGAFPVTQHGFSLGLKSTSFGETFVGTAMRSIVVH